MPVQQDDVGNHGAGGQIGRDRQRGLAAGGKRDLLRSLAHKRPVETNLPAAPPENPQPGVLRRGIGRCQ